MSESQTICIRTENPGFDEDIEMPTTDSIVESMRWILKVYDGTGKLASFLAPTVAEGMYFHYELNYIYISIEIYNDGDVCYLVADKDEKKVISIKSIESVDELIKVIKQYC